MAKTVCIVRVGGQDVSSALNPYLTTLTVTDKAGSSSDACQIELDDKGGQILLPPDGVDLSVLLGDESGVDLVFTGVVDEVRSRGARSGGMTLSISAKGVDTKGKAKEPKRKHWDNKTLGDVFKEAASTAGLSSAIVSPALSSISRPYWAMQNESFLHFAQRIASEVGGTFKVAGNTAIIADRNGGTSASGLALPTFTATRGVNLISWEIAPILGRPRYKKATVRHYDVKTGTWQEETVEIADPTATAEFVDRHVAADKAEATARAKGHKKQSERGKGEGTVTVLGSTVPQPEADLILSGARPGVDGTYRIDSVEHSFSRGSGWTTKIDVKQPQGDAGTDSRSS